MNIYQHPLAWRWTKETHAVFPPDVIAAIEPLPVDEALALWKETSRFEQNDSLVPELFKRIEAVDASSFETARDWLLSQKVDLASTVTVLWHKDLGIRTTWQIFTSFWDDFCYPASDDVLVFPSDRAWILAYYHEEEFQFGATKRPPWVAGLSDQQL